MTDHGLPEFAGSDQSLFSPAQLERLARSEVDRAKRFGESLACLVIGVDRLEALHDLYGFDSKHEIFRSVVGYLREDTRASDFVAALDGDLLLAFVPHAPTAGVRRLVQRLLRGARRLSFEGDRRTIQVTLSVGLATLAADEPYASLVQRAAAAHALAEDRGGDRLVQAPAPAVEAERPAPAAATIDPAKLADLADVDPQQLVAALLEAARTLERSAPSVAESGQSQQIELLERRISKLSDVLERTERELARLSERTEQVEASAGRPAARRPSYVPDEAKKAMMSQLLEANISLRRALAAGHATRGQRFGATKADPDPGGAGPEPGDAAR